MIHEANCSQPPESNSDRIVPQGPTSGPQRSVLKPWISGKTYAIAPKKLASHTSPVFHSWKARKKSAKWLIWRQIHPLMSNPTRYTPEARSHPTTLSLRTPTDQHHWLGCQETSTSVYSRRRCSKAFRALPTIEGGTICYYELHLVLKK